MYKHFTWYEFSIACSFLGEKKRYNKYLVLISIIDVYKNKLNVHINFCKLHVKDLE